MVTVADFCAWLERFAPRELAADWDNVGLLLGDRSAEVRKAMTCLTVTPEVVAEAVREQVELIVSHHPVLFQATKKLSSQTSEGRLLLPLLRHGVAVYSPHTAFDNCPGGINDGLARRLNLRDVRPIKPGSGPRECKLVTFVPENDLTRVSDALFAAGAGIIGQYEQCSFRHPGTGTFYGTAGTNPTVGQAGRREEASELRLEVVVPEGRVEAVTAALRKAHSYEEPAYDVYLLRPRSQGGEGRIGTLPQPIALGELARLVKQSLSAAQVQVVGDLARPVSRVGIACGAAGRYHGEARLAGADVYLTGEMSFHECLAAQASRLGVILPGHHATERPGVEDLAHLLQHEFPTVALWASRAEHDPLTPIV